MADQELKDRVALVTGASRGLGKAIALRLAESGANVVVNDIGDAAPVAEEVKALGRQSLAVTANVSQAADVAKLFEATIAAYGRIDILVNNAGIDLVVPTVDLTEAQWDNVINVNLKG